MRVLIVEDEERLAEALKRGLAKKGFAADILADGEKALTRVLLYHADYDVIVLDLMLPSLDGFALCKEARAHDVVTPIIVLTARTDTESKVELLLAGADDYVVKPFSFSELLARIHAVLRRPAQTLPALLAAGEIELDTVERTARCGGAPVALTLKEFGLLEQFLRHPNEVINREDLIAHLWDFNYESFSNVIDVHVKNLRRKLARAGHADAIETVRGIGYRLRA
jgi:DNA-binding response OmpR family regulator